VTRELPAAVPAEAPVRVTVTGALQHLCPHVEEVDHGAVEVAWTCAGGTLELHSLRKYLDSYAQQRISHEELTHLLREDLAGVSGITDVRVITTWTTAGLSVHVQGA